MLVVGWLAFKAIALFSRRTLVVVLLIQMLPFNDFTGSDKARGYVIDENIAKPSAASRCSAETIKMDRLRVKFSNRYLQPIFACATEETY
jgi:hypothetical protein